MKKLNCSKYNKFKAVLIKIIYIHQVYIVKMKKKNILISVLLKIVLINLPKIFFFFFQIPSTYPFINNNL